MVVRRLKTYTSETGSIYRYYFVGKRVALRDEPLAPATEFIFDVTRSSGPTFAVSIFLRQHSLDSWQQKNGRDLVEPEQYAAAKMKLLRAFEDVEDLRETGRRLLIEDEELESFLAELGVD